MQLEFPGRGSVSLDRPVVMGILNVTPDSFSDGGKFDGDAEAVGHALDMMHQGAGVIDVGGESTRPGAARVSVQEQQRRVVSVIGRVRDAMDDAGRPDVAISIDTTRAQVAAAALDAGAGMINDVSGGREDAEMLSLAAERGVPIALMHMRGEPATMQKSPTYDNVVSDVKHYLEERALAAESAGVARGQVLLDPGIGFGKTVEHNVALLRALPELVAMGWPVLLGASRKSFLAKLQGHEQLKIEPDPAGGTAATTALGTVAGVAMFRVHDVALNCQAVCAATAIRDARSGDY